MPRKNIYEVEVTRENGDPDTLYLCAACLKTTDDFLSVKSKKRCTSQVCDRCG